MAHNYHGLLSHAVLVFAEGPPDYRRDAQALEEIAAHPLQLHLLGRRCTIGDRHGVGVRHTDQRFECLLFARQPPVEIRVHGGSPIAPTGELFESAIDVGDSRGKALVDPLDDPQRVRVLHRQGPQDRRIDQTEDGCVRAYADGQGEDYRGHQRGRLPQLAQPVAGVLYCGVKPLDDAHRPGLLLDSRDVAETHARFASVVPLGGVHLEMELKLLLNFGGMAVASKRFPDSGPHPHKVSSQAVRRIFATAAEMACHRFSSASSLRRPLGVKS